MKVVVQILCFDGKKFLEACIANCYPFVDKIYLLHSVTPWNYNPNASDNYTSEISIADLNKLDDPENKIEILSQTTSTEHEKRNIALKKARSEGFDVMLVQDLDEFYYRETYASLLQQIMENPNFDYYRTPWYLFWKDYRHVVLFKKPNNEQHNSTTNYNACFAINLNHSSVKFEFNRLPTTRNSFMLKGHCLHFSYVLSDFELTKKMFTWSHAHQVTNIDYWLKYKWLRWSTNTRNISPFGFTPWVKAVPFQHHTDIQKLFNLPKVELKQPIPQFSIKEYIFDFYYSIKYSLKKIISKYR